MNWTPGIEYGGGLHLSSKEPGYMMFCEKSVGMQRSSGLLYETRAPYQLACYLVWNQGERVTWNRMFWLGDRVLMPTSWCL